MKQIATIALIASASVFGVSVALAQSAPPQAAESFLPERAKNLQVLRADTPPAQVLAQMKRFTAALGVRCTYCHVGEEGKPLSTFDFASDAKQEKEIARAMMRLTYRLNTQDFPAIAGLDAAPADGRRITCFTCHRGAPHPLRPPAAVAPASSPPAVAATPERG